MIKKIVLGTLLVGLVGLLVAGGINRTVNKTGSEAENHGRNDRSTEESDSGQNGGQGGNRSQSEASGAQGSTNGAGRAQVDSWLELAGTAVGVDDEELLVELPTGEQLSVTGRPWRFALENDFAAVAGDTLTLTGFYEADEFEVGAIANDSSGQAVQIREESGRPLWAGGGRRDA